MMNIKFFRPVNKGALIASFTLEIPKMDLTINGMTLMQSRNGDYFIGFPSYKYTNKEGEEKYVRHVSFSKETTDRLQKKIMPMLEEELAKTNVEEPPKAQNNDIDDLPF